MPATWNKIGKRPRTIPVNIVGKGDPPASPPADSGVDAWITGDTWEDFLTGNIFKMTVT